MHGSLMAIPCTPATRRIKNECALSRVASSTMDGNVGDDMKVMIWDTLTARLIHSLEGVRQARSPQGFSSMLYTCAFSPDGTLAPPQTASERSCFGNYPVASSCKKWCPAMYTWDEVQRLCAPSAGIRSLAFNRSADPRCGGHGPCPKRGWIGGKSPRGVV